jgi:hypothetical protein
MEKNLDILEYELDMIEIGGYVYYIEYKNGNLETLKASGYYNQTKDA